MCRIEKETAEVECNGARYDSLDAMDTELESAAMYNLATMMLLVQALASPQFVSQAAERYTFLSA